jgi:hypothetical protein
MVRKLTPNTSTTSMNIEDLPVGIYLLKVQSANKNEKTVKIIKK